MTINERDQRLRELDMQIDAKKYEFLLQRKLEMESTANRLKTSIVRDMVAASLYPFAIDQSSHTPWRTETERRAKLRMIAGLCYMAADEFMKARDDHAPR
jgi:hypothetical protein